MKRAFNLILLTGLAAISTGCKSPREDGPFDEAWRSGYGFHNPNPDRARKGLPPLNFDGSVHRP